MVTDALLAPAPIYDCASSFYPKLASGGAASFANNEESLSERVRSFPRAAFLINNKKPKYHEFLVSGQGASARQTLLRIVPNIDVKAIIRFIQELPSTAISESRKSFYADCVSVRYEEILLPGYRLALA